MASVPLPYSRSGVWRFSRSDAGFVTLAAVHAAILLMCPVAPLIAIGLWWNSNTIAHNFIHRPFFRSAFINQVFSAALSVLLGIPQTLWRDRHLAHHAGREWRLRASWPLAIETALVLILWAVLASPHTRFFLLVYAPGYLAGLVLCAIQGHWEHATDQPTSHYGRIYNLLCFNDGYHAQHHAAPGIPWTDLPQIRSPAAHVSAWPPLLRWLEIHPLEALERFVLRSEMLQRFVLGCHKRAFQALLPQLQTTRRVMIVGGGLFPRTALILRELLPAAHITIVDSDPRNLKIARGFLANHVEYRNGRYTPGELCDCDLTVIPLCLDGKRQDVYTHPPSPFVLVHDWAWHSRGNGVTVSTLLLKRLNLIHR